VAVFDRHSAGYERAVEQAVAFAGQPHDVYIRAKAHKLLELARRRLGHDPDAILDVGCGLGLFGAHLVACVEEFHGVDTSAVMIERAREAVPAGRFAVGEAARLPYEDDRFDVAFASCLLHHVDPDGRVEVLAEMRRVTRPGGLVVVFEHNPVNPLTRRVVRSCSFDEGVRLLSRREASGLLRAAALTQTDAAYILFFPWRRRVLEAVESGLGSVPLGAQYVVAARATA
jgi:ubiquinone/menaquinone biosynthesis C-methylase UbiE